jgi:hypothetical protein
VDVFCTLKQDGICGTVTVLTAAVLKFQVVCDVTL